VTSRKLKAVIALLLVNALCSIGYVVALARGVSLIHDPRAWTEVVPEIVFIALFSLLAAFGMARRTTWGFALGMLAAGAHVGAAGPVVVRFALQAARVGATPDAPAPHAPLLAIYLFVFGVALAIYLWTRRHVFAVGV
jgi:hypothetical protein